MDLWTFVFFVAVMSALAGNWNRLIPLGLPPYQNVAFTVLWIVAGCACAVGLRRLLGGL